MIRALETRPGTLKITKLFQAERLEHKRIRHPRAAPTSNAEYFQGSLQISMSHFNPSQPVDEIVNLGLIIQFAKVSFLIRLDPLMYDRQFGFELLPLASHVDGPIERW